VLLYVLGVPFVAFLIVLAVTALVAMRYVWK
jgi:hypothetical protein